MCSCTSIVPYWFRSSQTHNLKLMFWKVSWNFTFDEQLHIQEFLRGNYALISVIIYKFSDTYNYVAVNIWHVPYWTIALFTNKNNTKIIIKNQIRTKIIYSRKELNNSLVILATFEQRQYKKRLQVTMLTESRLGQPCKQTSRPVRPQLPIRMARYSLLLFVVFLAVAAPSEGFLKDLFSKATE